MNRLLWIVPWLLWAQTLWAAEPFKIGVIDVQKAIQESEAGKRAKERFQAQVKKAEGELLKERQELERLKGDMEKKGLLLREEEQRNLEKEFQKKRVNYERSVRDSQEELRQRDAELTNEIVGEIMKIVAELGKSEKFNIVLERSQVLYSDRAIDVTDKVVELFNRRGTAKAPKSK